MAGFVLSSLGHSDHTLCCCCPSTDDQAGVSHKEVMELLLLTQYFDSVKDVANASKASTLFMSHSPAAVNKVIVLHCSPSVGLITATAAMPGSLVCNVHPPCAWHSCGNNCATVFGPACLLCAANSKQPHALVFLISLMTISLAASTCVCCFCSAGCSGTAHCIGG